MRTSNPYWVGDAQLWDVSYTTTQAVASVLSIHGCNSDGFGSTLTSAAAPNADWKVIDAQSGELRDLLASFLRLPDEPEARATFERPAKWLFETSDSLCNSSLRRRMGRAACYMP